MVGRGLGSREVSSAAMERTQGRGNARGERPVFCARRQMATFLRPIRAARRVGATGRRTTGPRRPSCSVRTKMGAKPYRGASQKARPPMQLRDAVSRTWRRHREPFKRELDHPPVPSEPTFRRAEGVSSPLAPIPVRLLQKGQLRLRSVEGEAPREFPELLLSVNERRLTSVGLIK